MEMMNREQFDNTNWKMTYEEYITCYCPNCECKGKCPHNGAFRRVPEVDGGLGLCPRLSERSVEK